MNWVLWIHLACPLARSRHPHAKETASEARQMHCGIYDDVRPRMKPVTVRDELSRFLGDAVPHPHVNAMANARPHPTSSKVLAPAAGPRSGTLIVHRGAAATRFEQSHNLRATSVGKA